MTFVVRGAPEVLRLSDLGLSNRLQDFAGPVSIGIIRERERTGADLLIRRAYDPLIVSS